MGVRRRGSARPGAARFDARAVSTVTAFVVPPDVVADVLKHEPTADALWRAAFGLLAATLLRDDLSTAEVTPQVLRAATTKARVTRHAAGDTVGPFKARVDPQLYPPSELVVLMKGAVHDAAEGDLEGPCVLVPSTAAALSSEQTERFGKLAARMGLASDGGAVTTPEKRDGGGNGASTATAASRRFGFAAEKPGTGMLSVDEDAVVLRVSLGKKPDDAEEERIREGLEKQSYLPGLEGSGWGKFGKNPLVLSRGGGRADELKRELFRRLSVNVGTVLQRGAHHARNGSSGADEFAGILERTKSGSAARVSSRDGSPEVSAHNGVAFVKSPHGSSENLGALASEGTDLWSSSLDRTSAHILSRDVKRDIFATRRSSVGAQHKAATLEAASLAGSLLAARSDVSPTATHRSSRLCPSPRASINSSNLFAPGRQLSPSTSPDRNSLERGARRDSGTSMPARMTRQQLAQLRNEASSDDAFPPRRGQNNEDTFPPRGTRDPQDTFPPREGGAATTRSRPGGQRASRGGVLGSGRDVPAEEDQSAELEGHPRDSGTQAGQRARRRLRQEGERRVRTGGGDQVLDARRRAGEERDADGDPNRRGGDPRRRDASTTVGATRLFFSTGDGSRQRRGERSRAVASTPRDAPEHAPNGANHHRSIDASRFVRFRVVFTTRARETRARDPPVASTRRRLTTTLATNQTRTVSTPTATATQTPTPRTSTPVASPTRPRRSLRSSPRPRARRR